MKRFPLFALPFVCLAPAGPAANAQLFPPQTCPGGRCPQACFPSPDPFVPIPAVIPRPMPAAPTPAAGVPFVENRADPVFFPRLRGLIADRPRLFRWRCR